MLAQARETVAALVGCGPLGLAAVTPSPHLAPGVDTPPIAGGRGALSDLDNGLVHVALRTDGLLDILGADRTHVAGLGAIVDGGDLGDEYDYAPPARDRLVAEPQEVWNRVLWSGPLTGCLESVRWYRWPERGDFPEDARDEATAVTEVTTRIELRHGEPFVRLSVTFDNQADDHRVRLHLPLPRPADRSHAEGQFAVVARGLTAEGGGGETPVPTFPAYGWVAAGGLAVLLDHVSEYELVDEGRTLAVTLLRSVGHALAEPQRPPRGPGRAAGGDAGRAVPRPPHRRVRPVPVLGRVARVGPAGRRRALPPPLRDGGRLERRDATAAAGPRGRRVGRRPGRGDDQLPRRRDGEP